MKSAELLRALGESVPSQADKVASVADFALDVVSDESVIRHLPVIGIAVKALQFRDAFARRLFERNVLKFLETLRNADRGKLQAALDEMAASVDKADDFADTLMQVFTTSEKTLKPQLIGQLLVSFAEEEISFDEYDRLTLMVIHSSIPALRSIVPFARRKAGAAVTYRVEEEPSLTSAGFGARFGTHFSLSAEGELLCRFGFREPVQFSYPRNR